MSTMTEETADTLMRERVGEALGMPPGSPFLIAAALCVIAKRATEACPDGDQDALTKAFAVEAVRLIAGDRADLFEITLEET